MYISAHDHNSQVDILTRSVIFLTRTRVYMQFTRMPDGVVYVVSGQSGGRGPFGPVRSASIYTCMHTCR